MNVFLSLPNRYLSFCVSYLLPIGLNRHLFFLSGVKLRLKYSDFIIETVHLLFFIQGQIFITIDLRKFASHLLLLLLLLHNFELELADSVLSTCTDPLFTISMPFQSFTDKVMKNEALLTDDFLGLVLSPASTTDLWYERAVGSVIVFLLRWWARVDVRNFCSNGRL